MKDNFELQESPKFSTKNIILLFLFRHIRIFHCISLYNLHPVHMEIYRCRQLLEDHILRLELLSYLRNKVLLDSCRITLNILNLIFLMGRMLPNFFNSYFFYVQQFYLASLISIFKNHYIYIYSLSLAFFLWEKVWHKRVLSYF